MKSAQPVQDCATKIQKTTFSAANPFFVFTNTYLGIKHKRWEAMYFYMYNVK